MKAILIAVLFVFFGVTCTTVAIVGVTGVIACTRAPNQPPNYGR